MDQSGLWYAAAACVMAGGLLVGGPGVVVALADPGGVGSRQGSDSGSAARDKKGGAADGAATSRRGGYGPRPYRPGQPGGDKPGQGRIPGEGTDPGTGQGGDGSGDGKDPDDPCHHHGGGDGGNGGGVGQPPPGNGGSTGPAGHNGRFPQPPVIVPLPQPHYPPPGPVEPDIVGATAGPAEAPAPEAEPPVLTMPLMPPTPEVAVGAGPRAELPLGTPSAPPEVKNEPLNSLREPIPSEVGRNDILSTSFRVGYSEYLRTAGVTEMATLALPGVGGILLLTAGGGFIGYRQAKAGHAVRTEGIARFLH